ncbi:MAG: hypothetical protein AMXMBFR23_03190 [Chloroflexota bacterium]
MRHMLDQITTVGVLGILFSFIVALGVLMPHSRELIAEKLPEFAAAAFYGLLALLGVSRGKRGKDGGQDGE